MSSANRIHKCAIPTVNWGVNRYSSIMNFPMIRRICTTHHTHSTSFLAHKNKTEHPEKLIDRCSSSIYNKIISCHAQHSVALAYCTKLTNFFVQKHQNVENNCIETLSLYHQPGHCTTGFMHKFYLFFCAFLLCNAQIGKCVREFYFFLYFSLRYKPRLVLVNHVCIHNMF